MTTVIVRKYLTQDFSLEEKKSYLRYILRKDEKSSDWIEKASNRREPLLLLELKCKHEDDNSPDGLCGAWVNVKETGECFCSNNHTCYNTVIDAINRISNPT